MGFAAIDLYTARHSGQRRLQPGENAALDAAAASPLHEEPAAALQAAATAASRRGAS